MGYASADANVLDRYAGLAGEAFHVCGGKKLVHATEGVCINALMSIAFLQTDGDGSLCKHAHMDADQQEAREILERMLSVSGAGTLTKLARRAGLVPSTLTRFWNKPDVKNTLSMRTLRKLSAATGVPLPAHLTGGKKLVPIVGYVGAGEEVYPIDDAAMGGSIDDFVDAPGDVEDDSVAVRVRGTSMFPAYWDGDVLIYRRDWHFVRDACLYNECIVKISDGPTLVKRLMPGSAENVYTLVSYNAPDIIDARIDWAAPVQIHDKRKRRAKAG